MKGKESVARRRMKKRVSSVFFFPRFLSLCVSECMCRQHWWMFRYAAAVVIGGAVNDYTTDFIRWNMIFFQLYETHCSSRLPWRNRPELTLTSTEWTEKGKCQAKDGLWTCAMAVFHFTSSEFPLVYYVHVVCARSFFRSHSIRTRAFFHFSLVRWDGNEPNVDSRTRGLCCRFPQSKKFMNGTRILRKEIYIFYEITFMCEPQRLPTSEQTHTHTYT